MIRRHIEPSVLRALADTPVVLINGARQTGKTTLARAIATRTGATYFTLDDAATLALAAGDPAGFIRNLPGPVVLDRPDGSVAGIEVKASATAGPGDFAALRALRDQLGTRFRGGAVLYLGDRLVPSGDALWLAPVTSMWA
jgi:hypothetical protein